MKRQLFFVPVILTAFALFILPACTKREDLRDEPGFCPIKKLFSTDLPFFQLELDIAYNADGNPVSMLDASSYPDEQAQAFRFRYDRHKRLSDYLESYAANIGVLIWQRYAYPDKRTVIDSTWAYGDALITDPDPDRRQTPSVTIFKLDELGRIIRSLNAAGETIADYSYDDRGNLIRNGVVYDNKINPYRTNPVWMFINKDYSLNNPSLDPEQRSFQITDYNAIGLPLQYQGITYFFNDFDLINLKIEYACDPGQAGTGGGHSGN